jgi:hypothetical protein
MHTLNLIARVLVIYLLIFTSNHALAQNGLNFQGVARTANNIVLASQNISIRLSILNGSTNGTIEYQETKTVTTNAQGLFNIVIGDGTSNNTLGNYAFIDWKQMPKFLKMEIDPNGGNSFTTLGTTQLQSVAYANFANGVTAENIVGLVPVARGGTGTSNLPDLKNSLQLNNVNNTADSAKPINNLTKAALNQKINIADSTSSYVTPTQLRASRTIIDTSFIYQSIRAKVNVTDFINELAMKEDRVNKSTATDLGGLNSSDTLYPSQKAVKAYITANNASGGIADGGITTIKLADGAVTDTKVTSISISKIFSATTAYIAPSTNRNYLTDIQAGVISNTSGANTGDETTATIKSKLGISTLSGSNTGDQTITLTGDITGTGTGTFTSTLTNSGVLSGTYGSITSIPSLTIDSKGRIINAISNDFIPGVNSVISISSISNVNGATISGTTIALTPADANNGGIVTNGVQTFSGSKTFYNPVLINPEIGDAKATSLIIGNITPTTNYAALQINSNNKGFLPPRLTKIERSILDGTNELPNRLEKIPKGTTIYCTDCGSGELQVYNGLSWTNGSSEVTKNLSPGDFALGGIVGYILSPGDNGYVEGMTKGVIIDIKHLNDVDYQFSLSNNNLLTKSVVGTSRVLGSGMVNTSKIVTTLANFNGGNYAAKHAIDYEINNYSDWYLPSIDELKRIRNNEVEISKKLQNLSFYSISPIYISSSAIDDSKVWAIDFKGDANYSYDYQSDSSIFEYDYNFYNDPPSFLLIRSFVIGSNATDGFTLNSTSQGFLPPRLNSSQKNQLISPQAGTIIYCTDCISGGVTMYYNGSRWVELKDSYLTKVEPGPTGDILKSNGSAWVSTNDPSIHYIGEQYGGGIVFYVFDGGRHGLIAAAEDQEINGFGIDWDYSYPTTFIRASGDGIGAGLKNTSIIIARNSLYPTAASVCNDYSFTVEGVKYGDWYLPSKFELDLLSRKTSIVRGFYNGFRYWSSTEFDQGNAWCQFLVQDSIWGGGEDKFSMSKRSRFRVRPIRMF